MKILKVNSSYGFTVNIGNYESVKIVVGMEAEIDNNVEDADVAMIDLQEKCRDLIIKEVSDIREAHAKR